MLMVRERSALLTLEVLSLSRIGLSGKFPADNKHIVLKHHLKSESVYECSQQPLLVSIVGEDGAADAVRASLHAAGLQSHALMAKPDVGTATCLTLVDAGT